jgi:predicted CoA-binding protein
MESRIKDFLAQETFALYGMSRSGNKFGNKVYHNLTSKGYKIYPIHPEAESIGAINCWSALTNLPEKVDGAVIVVPPEQTERIVERIVETDIKRVWMQPGAESAKAIRYCEENRISVIYQECVMMLSEKRKNRSR